MTKIFQITLLTLYAIFLVSCTADSKKVELESLKAERREIELKIKALEGELMASGEMNEVKTTEVLVATMPLDATNFTHEVEVRGTVQSRKNVLVSAETMGRVEKISVEEGQTVKAGTKLVFLDADLIADNISEVETSLELAEAVFVRQKNLWDQKIGTEIQYLQAKNNRDALQKRLATLKTQLKQFEVKAPFAGTVDDVIVKVGEMAQPGVPLIRVVNPDEMYIMSDVSEAFLGKFQQGDIATVYFPVQDKSYKATITSVSKVINNQNRTFTIEVALPTNEAGFFQPNQVAILKLVDYANEAAITVPTKLIQTDASGKYVYVAGSAEGKTVALKRRVQTGLSFNSKTEILAGLTTGDQIIEKGYRDVNEGTEIKLASL